MILVLLLKQRAQRYITGCRRYIGKHCVDLSGAGKSDDTSPCRFLAFPKMENVSKHAPPKIPPGGSSASVI